MRRLVFSGVSLKGTGHMASIKNNDKVAIHYTGKLTDGTVFDSSEGREPLEFAVGSGQIIPGLDAAMPGLSVGDNRTVEIACADAYGPINPQLQQAVPREGIPDDIPLDIGTQLQMQTNEGRPLPVTVIAADDATVTLDANHPLAGKDLIFEFEVVRIEPATA